MKKECCEICGDTIAINPDEDLESCEVCLRTFCPICKSEVDENAILCSDCGAAAAQAVRRIGGFQ
jgi:hypothetical protein